MKYLGKVDDIIFNGKLIVRTSFKTKVSAKVVTKHKKELGKIQQIIGPVKNPYVTIIPSKNVKATFDLIGTKVYLL